MTYSVRELAASGDAVRALRVLLARRGTNLTVFEFGPGGAGAASLWRLVLGNHRLAVWAHGLCTGTVAASLHTQEIPGLVEAARAVAPVIWSAGELRASGLQPYQAADLIEAVLSHCETHGRHVA